MKVATNIYINRKFNCPVEELFNWFTSPDLIAKWFGPDQYSIGEVTNDLIIGGIYKIELVRALGDKLYIQGNYLEIERPFRLCFTFNYAGINNPPPSSIVKITFENIDPNSAMLYLEQIFETLPSDFIQRTKAWENMLSKLSQKFE